MAERTYTTGGDDRGSIAYLHQTSVEGLPAMIKKITVTDDGKLAIALEGEVGDEETLNQVRNLLLAQRGPPQPTCSRRSPTRARRRSGATVKYGSASPPPWTRRSRSPRTVAPWSRDRLCSIFAAVCAERGRIG